MEIASLRDFEDEIGLKLGPGITLCSTGGCKKDVEFSVPGNIHFAYLDGAAGIFGVEVQAGAGWVEIHDPAHDPESEQYTGPWEREWNLVNPLLEPWQWNFGDEAKDHEAVTFGIYLWKNYQSRLTLGDFKRELANHANLFSSCKPDTNAVPADVAARWPSYPVDKFHNKGESFVLKQGNCP